MYTALTKCPFRRVSTSRNWLMSKKCSVKVAITIPSHWGYGLWWLKLFQFAEHPHAHFNLLFKWEDPLQLWHLMCRSGFRTRLLWHLHKFSQFDTEYQGGLPSGWQGNYAPIPLARKCIFRIQVIDILLTGTE